MTSFVLACLPRWLGLSRCGLWCLVIMSSAVWHQQLRRAISVSIITIMIPIAVLCEVCYGVEGKALCPHAAELGQGLIRRLCLDRLR